MRAMILLLLWTGLLIGDQVYADAEFEHAAVVINEVCWGGAPWDPGAEWIELRNNTAEPVDLDGWTLRSSDGAPHIRLSGTLPALDPVTGSGYFLLVRDHADLMPGVEADLVYEGALSDAGESLVLLDASGHVVDTANAWPKEAIRRPWPAGTNHLGHPANASMERIDPTAPDHPSNWASCSVDVSDGGETAVRGTPKAENSAFLVPPLVQIVIQPALPAPGDPVSMEAILRRDSSSPIVSYQWVFGDGAEIIGRKVLHTYAEEGWYDLALLLIDTHGRKTTVRRQIHVVVSSSPTADFSVIRDPDRPMLRAGDPVMLRDESASVDADLVAWAWDLGDGATASGPQVQHIFSRAGTFVVELTVTNERALSSTQTQSLVIAPRLPVADFVVVPDLPQHGRPVLFDAGASFHPDGVIRRYQWDFTGDGEINLETDSPVAEHTYPRGGAYSVSLTVIDEWGGQQRAERSVTVHARPTAQFTVSTFTPDELEPLTLSDQSSPGDAALAMWAWTFGDGQRSEEQSPSHVFLRSGTYHVSLTVTDEAGADDTATAQIQVQNLSPIPNLSVKESTLPTGSTFTFDASGSYDPSPQGQIQRYEWSLCQGCDFSHAGSSPMLSHLFSEQGSYVVRVRVTDCAGESAVSCPLTITVTNRPPVITAVSWVPRHPTDGEDVVFSLSASDPDGEITGWTWSLSDKVVSTVAEPTLVFDTSGVHPLRVQVRDNHGALSEAFTVGISIQNAPPVAQFTVTRPAPGEDRCVQFDASSSYDPSPQGQIAHVAWDFGDGITYPGSSSGSSDAARWKPMHCYSTAGTYTVTLVVIDDQGALSTAQKTILIDE